MRQSLWHWSRSMWWWQIDVPDWEREREELVLATILLNWDWMTAISNMHVSAVHWSMHHHQHRASPLIALVNYLRSIFAEGAKSLISPLEQSKDSLIGAQSDYFITLLSQSKTERCLFGKLGSKKFAVCVCLLAVGFSHFLYTKPARHQNKSERDHTASFSS